MSLMREVPGLWGDNGGLLWRMPQALAIFSVPENKIRYKERSSFPSHQSALKHSCACNSAFSRSFPFSLRSQVIFLFFQVVLRVLKLYLNTKLIYIIRLRALCHCLKKYVWERKCLQNTKGLIVCEGRGVAYCTLLALSLQKKSSQKCPVLWISRYFSSLVIRCLDSCHRNCL